MATKKDLEAELQKQINKITEQQAVINQMGSDLERVRAERGASRKEIDTLRLEIKRLDDLNRKIQNKVAISERHDVSVQHTPIIEKPLSRVQENNPQPSDDFQNINNSDLIMGMLQHFQTLQVNLVLPIFEPEKTYPYDFIREFEKYCIRKNILEFQKLMLIEDALQGPAKVWFDTVSVPFCNYDDFKIRFLEKFFSLEVRMKAKNDWENRRFSDKDRSLQLYYNEQIKLAKSAVPRMEPHEVNFVIVNQFPQRVRDILATIDYGDRDKITKVLARLDLSNNSGQERNWYQVNNSGGGYFANHKGASQNDRHQESGESSQNYRKNNNCRDRSQPRQGHYQNNSERSHESQVTGPRNTQSNENRSDNRNNDKSQNGNSVRSNVRAIKKATESDFVETLCWDVKPSDEDGEKNYVMRVVSPKMLIDIDDKEYEMMIDTGSEITCISEDLYNEFKKGKKIIELPVSNIAVYGAVGRKTTTIRKQIQLTIKVGDQEIQFPFLVVPGLSTKLIGGVDWQSKFKMSIDFEKNNIIFNGKKLPKNKISFYSTKSEETARVCVLVQGKEGLYYDVQLNKKNPLNDVEKNARESEVNKQDDLRRLGSLQKNDSIMGDENLYSDDFYNENRNDDKFENEIDEYIENINTLTMEQKVIVRDLLLTNRQVFSNLPGCTTAYQHKIYPLSENFCIKKSYPPPAILRHATDNEINRMEGLDVIERANARFCNPLRVVQKKDGTVRVCLDARFLNKNIASDHESTAPMEDLLQDIEGTGFMSTTDFVSGYWQVPLAPESRQYTAFLYNGTCYQFKRIPFGLKTAGSGFIRAVSLGLGQELLSRIKTYVDDLFIASQTFEEHVDILDKLFKKLIELGFTLSLKKSCFFRESVKFLGVIIDKTGVRVDPDKLGVIQEFSRPMNKKQLQGFLGVCGFSRRFVHKHSDYVSAFRDLLSSKNQWNWTSQHDIAFASMKQNFLKAVTLHHVVPGRKFRLQTDASDVGISGILQQVDEEGEVKIVSLTSRVLTKQEIRYTVTEKELLAIIFSLLKFRKYLIGVKFEILTDHKALTFMLNTPHHNARITRWVLFAQEYDFEIYHCKGSENVIADYFSRNFEGKVSDNSNKNKSYLISVIAKQCVELINDNDIENKLIASLEMKKNY